MSTQLGKAAPGDVLAGRYRLEELISTNAESSCSNWRGMDIILARPIAIEICQPGGSAAQSMLDAAIIAGQIVHPGVAGVYDAVDEGTHAYVVREWVPGQTLTSVLAGGTMDLSQALSTCLAITEGLYAIHQAGYDHGNIQPASIHIRNDGEITLNYLLLTSTTDTHGDLIALGGIIYACLTSRWPQISGIEVQDLPLAPVINGQLCSPRQVKAHIPDDIDRLCMELLNGSPKTITAVISQLRDMVYQQSKSLTSSHFTQVTAAYNRPISPADIAALSLPADPTKVHIQQHWWSRRPILLGLGVMICLIGLSSWFIARAVSTGGSTGYPPVTPSGKSTLNSTISISNVSVLDSPGGDGAELSGAAKTIDGNTNTAWKTQDYNFSQFGRIKKGMGILVDLGNDKTVTAVTVEFTTSGATASIMHSSQAHQSIEGYTVASTRSDCPQITTFQVNPEVKDRYWLIWITNLPQNSNGKYSVGIEEIKLASSSS